MSKRSVFLLLLASVLLSSCRARFGHTTAEVLISAMNTEEKKSLLFLEDGRTAALERMGIPSVTVAEPEEIPGAEMLLRTWDTDLAYQAGTIICSASSMEKTTCVRCPVLMTEDPEYSGMMTAATGRGIRDCGYGLILGPETPDLENVIAQVEPWAVVADNGIPLIDGYDGPVFVTGFLSDTISGPVLDMCVAKVLAFIERSLDKPVPSIDDSVMNITSYRKSLLEKGMVLLKNNGMIPLKTAGQRIALYGSESYGLFDESLAKAGFRLEPSVVSYYSRHSVTERQAYQLRADAIASNSAVIVFSDSLDAKDMKLVDDVCAAFHSKSRMVAVVLATGGPVNTEGWEGRPDAIVYSGIADSDVASVVSNVFKGTVTASGRLSGTWSSSYPFGHGLGAYL